MTETPEEIAYKIHTECYVDISQSEHSHRIWDVNLAATLIASRDAQIRKDEGKKWEPYAQHKVGCDAMKGWSKVFSSGPKPCSCGLAAIRAAIIEKEGEE